MGKYHRKLRLAVANLTYWLKTTLRSFFQRKPGIHPGLVAEAWSTPFILYFLFYFAKSNPLNWEKAKASLKVSTYLHGFFHLLDLFSQSLSIPRESLYPLITLWVLYGAAKGSNSFLNVPAILLYWKILFILGSSSGQFPKDYLRLIVLVGVARPILFGLLDLTYFLLLRLFRESPWLRKLLAVISPPFEPSMAEKVRIAEELKGWAFLELYFLGYKITLGAPIALLRLIPTLAAHGLIIAALYFYPLF